MNEGFVKGHLTKEWDFRSTQERLFFRAHTVYNSEYSIHGIGIWKFSLTPPPHPDRMAESFR
jgi:hypothetical protein